MDTVDHSSFASSSKRREWWQAGSRGYQRDRLDIVITLDRDGKEVVPLLIGLLNDEKPVVRIKAATTIWVIEKKA
jgi:hypothetical protein